MVQADLFGAELLERLAKVFGEAFDLIDVGVDRALCEVTDEHIVRHTLENGGQCWYRMRCHAGSLLGDSRGKEGTRRKSPCSPLSMLAHSKAQVPTTRTVPTGGPVPEGGNTLGG